MSFKLLKNLKHNGKRYKLGDLYGGSDAEELLKKGLLERSADQPMKSEPEPKAEKPKKKKSKSKD